MMNLTQQPLVSVIIPCYRSERFLALTLESVLRQSYASLEVVVVDDGSPDASASIARTFAERDGRVRVVVQENAGVASARNRGMAESAGELLVFLDADDVMLPDAIKIGVESLTEHPTLRVCLRLVLAD